MKSSFDPPVTLYRPENASVAIVFAGRDGHMIRATRNPEVVRKCAEAMLCEKYSGDQVEADLEVGSRRVLRRLAK